MREAGRSIRALQRETLAIVLAGGRGTRLHQLTANRSKPAVPFAGKFRIIDFVLSNCINSGIRRICILTQYKAHSLMHHLQDGWSFHRPQFGECIDVIPAQQRVGQNWYLGTADAVYQNLDIIESYRPEFVLVLAGDHIYKMDYALMLAQHLEHEADVTVGCVEVAGEQASEFGLMDSDDDYRIVDFVEKPSDPGPHLNADGYALASMGIYLFKREFLFDVLRRDAGLQGSSHDFGKDILPSLIADHRVMACPLTMMGGPGQRYWRDVGTIDAYWEANMDLIGVTPELNLYETDWPVMTCQEQLPPAKFVFDDEDRRGIAIDSMVASGCIVSGARVERSLLSTNVRINSWAEVRDSVLLPGVQVGRRAKIRRAIIDSDCRIPVGMEIGYDEARDKARFHVSPSGIVLVTPEMLGSKGGSWPMTND